jgi:hypothetical protein
MKALTKTILLCCALLMIYALVLLILKRTTAEVPAQDSYLVSRDGSTVILIATALLLLIFLAIGLFKKFASIQTNAGLAIGSTFAAAVIYRIIRLQNNYLAEMVNEDAIEREPYLIDLENKIDLGWGLLGLWAIGICLLIIRLGIRWQKRAGRTPE